MSHSHYSVGVLSPTFFITLKFKNYNGGKESEKGQIRLEISSDEKENNFKRSCKACRL